MKYPWVFLQHFVSVWVDHYLKLKTFPKTTFPSGIPFSFWDTLLLSAHLYMFETWPVPSLAALARFLLQLSSALCVDDALRVCEVDVADVRHHSDRLFINPCPMLAHLKMEDSKNVLPILLLMKVLVCENALGPVVEECRTTLM